MKFKKIFCQLYAVINPACFGDKLDIMWLAKFNLTGFQIMFCETRGEISYTIQKKGAEIMNYLNARI